MPYFLLAVAVVVGLWLMYLGLRGMHPRNLRKAAGVMVAVVAGLVLLLVAISGRLGPLGWVAMLLPAILQWRNIRQGLKNMRGPTPGQNSDIETRYLRMTLEHVTGVLRGTVLEGRFRGRTLDELGLGDLLDLLGECRIEDPPSAEVLESYLDRVHGAAWRSPGTGDAGTGGQGSAGGSSGGSSGSAAGGAMTARQAYEILGLKPGASDREIREAHRRLLKANHPDLGGSTWLAAQINLAKDLLLPDG